MRNRTVFLASVLLAAGFSVDVARADTVLNLSVSDSVTIMPDRLRAAILAEAVAQTAQAAQAQVNTMTAQALSAARSVATVTAATADYSVWHETEPKNIWHARQGVTLDAANGQRDGQALLSLVGRLQASGLAVTDLSWQLSPALAEKSYEQAMAKAIDKLSSRAQAAATLLHMKLNGFQRVNLGDESDSGPRPLMRMMGVNAAVAAPEPNAQAQPVTVPASVSGEARLESGQ